MQDRSINNALLELRKQIVRGDGRGRGYVEALLAMRGVPLPPVLPPKPANAARRSQMVAWILGALHERPMIRRELVAHLATVRPDVPIEALYWRTDSALSKLRQKGQVRREGRLWYAK